MSYSLSKLRRIIYPSSCRYCNLPVAGNDHGLCITCWKGISYCGGYAWICDKCGITLQTVSLSDTPEALYCESCFKYAHTWSRGRSAIVYEGIGRKIVLSLKHADRTDLAPLCAQWMIHAAGSQLLEDATLLVPVPLHWTRMLKRKYNQSLELARNIQRATNNNMRFMPHAIKRQHATLSQGHMDRQDRYANVANAFRANKKVHGHKILLVDDVMTTGATLDACTQALIDAGAAQVNVLVLARVAQDFLYTSKQEDTPKK